jgi:Fe-S-cluster containining protein
MPKTKGNASRAPARPRAASVDRSVKRKAPARKPAKGDAPSAAAPTRAKRKLQVLSEQRTTVPCLSCALCCTYIAVAIDGPINAKAASEILWHLYHRDVSVYRDGDDEWMVQFEARCRHLNTDNTCAIYDQRPHICRAYSEESCEVNSPDEGITFYAPDAFLAYLAAKHKRIHKEVMAGYVPGPEHLGQDRRPRIVGPDFETRFRTLRAAGVKKT